MKINEIIDEELDEGWKSKLGGAALAGAISLGAGSAAAGDMPPVNVGDRPVASWSQTARDWAQSGLPDYIRSNHNITTRSDNVPGSLVQRTSDLRMSSVQGPNASGEYMVTVVNTVNGQRQVHKYITKNPPRELMAQN